MGIWKSFFKGFGHTVANFKVIIYLWVINLLFSLLVAAPIYAFVTRGLSKSLMGDRLLEKMDFFWLGDLIYRLQEPGYLLPFWLVVPAIAFLLLYVFLNGGILGSLKDSEEKVTLQGFFGHCGYYFWRFFKLFLVSILFYAVFVGVIYGLIGALLKLFTDSAVTQWPLIIVGFVKMALFVLLFSLVNMLFDYVKIRLVMTDGPRVINALLEAIRFLRRKLWPAWGLYLLIGVVFVIVSLVYLEVAQLIPDHGTLLILLLFLWQQLYILAKLGIKLHFFASQLTFYHTNY